MVVLGLLQLAVVVSLALSGPADAPHGAPIRIVAPPVVATSLVDHAHALAGRPVEAAALATAAEARDSIASGRSVAAVVVDLRRQKDVLYVAGANGDRLNHAVERQVSAVESSFGREVEVRDLVPARAGDAGARGVFVIVGIGVLLGFVGPTVITWLRGPVAPTYRRGALRLLVIAVSALGLGLALGAAAAVRYDGGFVAWSLLSAVLMIAVATTTLALESIFGVLGIGLAMTLVVLTGAPLLRLTHPLLLSPPWSVVTPWLPHGAALEAGTGQAYFGGPDGRPILVLVGWAALGLLTLVVARRERDRDLRLPPTHA